MTRNQGIIRFVMVPLLLLLGLVLLLPGNLARISGFLHGESFFDGLPASAWGQALHDEDNASAGKPTFDRLKKAGKPALPVLMEIALGKNSTGQHQACLLLVHQGDSVIPALVKALDKPAANDRQKVAVLLGDMGGKARPAVEPLARLLDDKNAEVRQAAMTALEKIGPQAEEATPDLIVILKGKGEDQNPTWLAQAAKVLGRIGPPARKAVPVLTACLQHPNPHVATEVFEALARMKEDALPAVPTLIEIVQNRQSPLRVQAAAALGKIGPAARMSVPTLIAALEGTNDPILRAASKNALRNMGQAAQPAVLALLTAFGRAAPIDDIGPAAIPELIQLLGGPQETIQTDAKFFLAGFRKKATPAMLEALAEDDNAALRLAVADMLGPESGEAKEVVPAFLAALQDDEPPVRQAARAGILRFGKAAQPYLERQLRGKDEGLRLEAVQILGRLGNEVRTSAPFLVAVLKDDMEKDPVVRLAVARTLATMGYHPSEALPILLEALQAGDTTPATLLLVAGHGRHAIDAAPVIATLLLQDPNWEMRRQAAFALGRIGLNKETSVPALKQALTDKHKMVRVAAAEVLAGSSYATQELAPLFIDLMKDTSKEVQAAAILGLRKLGKEAAMAIPQLHEFARTTAEDIKGQTNLRMLCVTALGAIGPSAQEAAPLLLSWLAAAKSVDMRKEIIHALGQMECKEASKLLEPFLQKGSGVESSAAALALWRIEKSPAALAFLQAGLRDKLTCAPFIEAVGQVGPPGQSAVPALMDILARAPDLDQRALAAQALGRIGVNARPAIKVLVEALAIPHSGVRREAARALGQFEEQAAAAVPRLLDLLHDDQSPQVRQAAADALWLIDPDAADNAKISHASAA